MYVKKYVYPSRRTDDAYRVRVPTFFLYTFVYFICSIYFYFFFVFLLFLMSMFIRSAVQSL